VTDLERAAVELVRDIVRVAASPAADFAEDGVDERIFAAKIEALAEGQRNAPPSAPTWAVFDDNRGAGFCAKCGNLNSCLQTTVSYDWVSDLIEVRCCKCTALMATYLPCDHAPLNEGGPNDALA
jgi:hypothetical protein